MGLFSSIPVPIGAGQIGRAHPGGPVVDGFGKSERALKLQTAAEAPGQAQSKPMIVGLSVEKTPSHTAHIWIGRVLIDQIITPAIPYFGRSRVQLNLTEEMNSSCAGVPDV